MDKGVAGTGVMVQAWYRGHMVQGSGERNRMTWKVEKLFQFGTSCQGLMGTVNRDRLDKYR